MSYENLVEEDAFLVLMSIRSLHYDVASNLSTHNLGRLYYISIKRSISDLFSELS